VAGPNSLGTVTIDVEARTARAETNIRKLRRVQSGWVSDMRKTAPAAKTLGRSLNVIEKELAQLKVAYNSGSISIGQYRTQQALLRKELMGFSLNATTQQLNRMNTMLVATAPAANKARKGLGTLRSAGASLTARMIGLNGTIGTFGSAIGQFAFGNLVTVGIIGGMFALAAGFRKIGEKARDAKKRAEELREELIRAAGPITLTSQQELGAERSRLTFLREQVRLLRDLKAEISRPIKGEGILEGVTFPAPTGPIDKLSVKIADLNAAIIATQQNIKEMVPSLNLKPLEDLAGLLAEVDRSLQNIRLRELDFITKSIVLSPGFEAVIANRLGPGGLTGVPTIRRNLRDPFERQRNRPRIPTLLDPDDKEQLTDEGKRIGETVGEAFGRTMAIVGATSLIREFLAGSKDIADAIKNILIGALSAAIAAAINIAINNAFKVIRERKQQASGGIFGSILGAAIGIGASFLPGVGPILGDVVSQGGPASGSAVPAGAAPPAMNVNVPPPANPGAMARDREWLNSLSESITVLKINGARL